MNSGISCFEAKSIEYLYEAQDLRRRGAEWYAEEEESEEPTRSAPGPESFHIGTDAGGGASKGGDAGDEGGDEGFTLAGRRKKRIPT
eukprot:4164895-Lingulodinium_polyedra.AAC.1